MKTQSFFAVLAIVSLLSLAFGPQPSVGQAVGEDAALSALVSEITKQQATLTANQAKMDEKLAMIAEDIRLARIFASRGR